MLYLTRKIGESIIINSNIEVKIIEVKGAGNNSTIKLGFEFPKEASVLRKEVFDKVVQQNLESALSTALTPDSQEDFLSALNEISKSLEAPAFNAYSNADAKKGKQPKVIVKRKIVKKSQE
jgi:carbon storage regulator